MQPARGSGASRPVAASLDTTWEVSPQPKRHKAICYVCHEPFDEDALRLRPAGTKHTRLLHPRCSGAYRVTTDKVVNYAELGPAAKTALTFALSSAAQSAPAPGEPPAAAAPSIGELKHMEQFDAISWDRCIECHQCLRHIPPHWEANVWEARIAACRAIVSADEAGDNVNFERGWKLFSAFDSLVLGVAPRSRGGKRRQGHATLNRIISARLSAFWSGAWHQLFTEIDNNRMRTSASAQPRSAEALAVKEVRSIEALIRNNAVSKAISRIIEPVTFATGPNVVGKLSSKFLDQPMDDRPPLPDASPEVVQELAGFIADELRHLPPMRGAGPTGTVYEHIRHSDAVPGATPLMARVLAMLPAGRAPREAIRIHRSARLSAPLKTNSAGQLTEDIRPLASGSAMWRTAMRAWVKMFIDEARDAVGDTQYGVG